MAETNPLKIKKEVQFTNLFNRFQANICSNLRHNLNSAEPSQNVCIKTNIKTVKLCMFKGTLRASLCLFFHVKKLFLQKICFLQTCIFSLLKMITAGLEWCGLLVDQCDVFISCLIHCRGSIGENVI